ncbi:sensor histidine kinase [Brachybacterium fresconis]|uniref:histidine kinase n=1 Tax=Brachybacterium fresconis TaxID=173363 RepID=A0ABS4YH86_9MICO|nr:sensor histidine kinase [Brachybacterium fresconis]MBP2408159.1 signal transduction histidine kinase [Brachybacterium fresconis]
MTDGSPQSTDAPHRRLRRLDPFRWIIENPGTVDLIGFGAGALLILVFAVGTGSFGWWTLFTVPMIAAGALCRVRPLLGVIVIGILAVSHLLVNIPVVGGDALTFYAMFCAVAYGGRAVGWVGVGAGFLGVLAQAGYWGVFTYFTEYGGPAQAAGTFAGLITIGSITIVAIWALASLQRARVRQLALISDRAEQAVREREQRTALAVADERARIAREMHDVVAHSLSVIIAQADGGRFVASQQPEKAVDVLGTIGETGRAALADMRSLLGVLRHEDETSFGPQPGPPMLEDLADRVRAAGLEVDLDLDGDLEDLSQALGMSVFRLVQESLTNVLKHAGAGASAAVRIHRTAAHLEIEILDDGQGTDPASDGQGHGLTGMRERMSVFGGTLQAGPLPGRGYRVRAVVPLDGTLRGGETADGRTAAAHPDDTPGPPAGPPDTATGSGAGSGTAAPDPSHPGGDPR